MPLPMVHLAVAVAMGGAKSGPRAQPAPEFLLGCLAPDAIHMRPGTDREDKRRTHLHLEDGLPDLLRRLRALCVAETQKELAGGYAAHLLTDLLWLESVNSRFRAEAAGLPADERRRRYYRDTDKVDFALFRGEPWRADVFAGLAAAQAQPVGGLLTAEEIGRWRARTLAWFDDASREPEEAPVYITEPAVRAFIRDAAGRMPSLLRQIGYGAP